MFAVIRTGGKQYRVAADDVITVDKIPGEPGDVVEIGDVLMLGGDEITVGAPTVAGASVAGEVVKQGRAPTVIAFKKRRRQNSRRKRGHRQEYTLLRITEILTDGRKPSKEKRAQPARAKKPAPSADASMQAAAEPAAPKAEASAKPKRRTKAAPTKPTAGKGKAKTEKKGNKT